ncbi:hypothetical protein [Serratia liquefaciens]|uniref:hypothetical protein n=1 Tax=Serratia liquefaciens TaxID=614 RepID=UPI00095BE736|nr:hypothetical protein [Serratia liquefaciens]OKP25630.1 hypothetical protein BSQ35_03960 [Serratia liquefaciens]
MKQAYTILVDDLLTQYHTKAANISAASAIAPAVRAVSLNDHAFRLSVGLTGLFSAAEAAGDGVAAEVIDSLVSRCNNGDIPFPRETQCFA